VDSEEIFGDVRELGVDAEVCCNAARTADNSGVTVLIGRP